MRELLWGLLLVAGAFALTVVVAMISSLVSGSTAWSGWLFTAMLLLLLLAATLVATRKKSRSEP